MQLECPRCRRVLEFSSERPSFCGFCGVALGHTTPGDAATITPPSPPSVAKVARPAPEDAPTVAPSAAVGTEDPEFVGGYRIVRRLGEGGMGSVYEAEESTTGRRVALKLISGQVAESAEVVERFRREGQLASAIAHPRCVFVLSADEEAGRPYIVMELMPGSNLKDLVDQHGPLEPERAVAKILDVIEGLEEAHRHGVLHRDVKPSNCFLEADGRVKIGDFGLARSLAVDAHLTATGAFLGTPLFASPEQLKGEAVDVRTDVYSVAATLYYLLTGRAPFQSSDLASLAIRVATEPAPPLRSLRPQLPASLDRVVLRGLERSRDRRWRNLQELRGALLPFATGRLSIGGMGSRVGAYLIDYILVTVLLDVAVFVYFWCTGQLARATDWTGAWSSPVLSVLVWLVWLAYFGVLEGVWGCSLGKWLLRLRVSTRSGSDPPGLWKGLWRSFCALFFLDLGTLPFMLGALLGAFPAPDPGQAQQVGCFYMALGMSFYPLEALGIGIVASTMRARNGYRGLHEFLSGTRVVRLPQAEQHRSLPLGALALMQPAGLPERIAAYEIRGALLWTAEVKLLLGEDTSLQRRVLIWLRSAAEPQLSSVRREVARSTRLRWLACGRLGELQWDAFLAPVAQPLHDVIAGAAKLSWPQTRPILEQLADELATAAADGTLPESLTTDQVWVQPNGVIQLLDMPNDATPKAGSPDGKDAAAAPQAMALLRRVAVLALEGRERQAAPPDVPQPPLQAPVPEHAARVVGRLLGSPRHYANVQEFQDDLAATRDRPLEVTRARRFAQLALLTALLFLGMCSCMFPASMLPGFQVGMYDIYRIREDEATLGRLDAGMTADYLISGSDANPFIRVYANRQLQDDLVLHDQLDKKLERSRSERQAHLESVGWISRRFFVYMEEQSRQPSSAAPRSRAAEQGKNFREAADDAANRLDAPDTIVGGYSMLAVVLMLLPWPIVWAVWAFAWRGGWTLRFLGLALVRADGRRAARLQCAWRTLLVWLPVVALLGLSAWLELQYWMTWDDPVKQVWLLWLSRACWWLTVTLLAACLALPLWSPSQSLHDRIAGTYVVPR